MYINTMFLTNVLQAFTYPLGVWNHNVAFGRMFCFGGLFLLLVLVFLKYLFNCPLWIFTLPQYMLQVL